MKKLNRFLLVLVLCLFVTNSYAALVSMTTTHALYPLQGEPTRSIGTLRSAAILTTSYVDTDFVSISGYNGIALLFDLSQGSLTSFEYKVWWSYDGNTWYQEATESVVSGIVTDKESYYTLTFAADVEYFKIMAFYANYIKLSVKGTGTVTNSSCAVYVVGAR